MRHGEVLKQLVSGSQLTSVQHEQDVEGFARQVAVECIPWVRGSLDVGTDGANDCRHLASLVSPCR